MSTTPNEIESFLQQRNLKYVREKDSNKFNSGFATDIYLNAEGKNSIGITISCEDQGEIVRIVAPKLYVVPPRLSTKHKAAIWRTILQVNWISRLVTFEYDINDGEIRAIYNIPLHDSSLNLEQFTHGIYSVPMNVDQFAPDLSRSIQSGQPLLGHLGCAKQFEKYAASRIPFTAPN